MTEKILSTKKNGMAMMMLFILLYIAAFLGIPASPAVGGGAGLLIGIISGIWITFGWIGFMGLKVLRPQEALVLTLFGKYKGTLKGDGFYWVNPFCTAVNPAANTKLRQSGDVKSDSAKTSTTAGGKVSRIKNILTPGSVVTTSKNDVDYIVTEYGMAKLRGQTIGSRVKQLISIAHPDFRDELTFEAKKRGIIV